MCVLLLSACEYRGPTLDWGVGQKAKGEEAPQLVPAGFGSSPAFLHAPQMGILGHSALNPTRTQQAGLPHLHHPRQGPSKRIVGGHLITSMNHSQIAPVQPDSGVGGACSGLGAWSWSWELAWVHQPLGALSVWQAGDWGSGPGLLAPPPPPPTVASPPPSACRLCHCFSVVLSGWLRPGGGAELTPPDPAAPISVILPPHPPPAPCSTTDLSCSSSQHPLGLALSAVVFFLCLSLSVFSLSPGHYGGGGRGCVPRPSSLHP